MRGGRRPVQTSGSFAGFPMVLGGVGATSGHENGLDVAAAANGVRQGCTAKIISQFASRTSYAVRTKATGINCR